MVNEVLLAAAGLAAGVLGGLLGVGGAVVMIPAMVALYGAAGIHQYQAAALVVVPLLILPSVPVHLKNKAVWTGVLVWIVPAALVAGAGGVLLSYSRVFSDQNVRYMNYLMGAFFLYVAVQNARAAVSLAPVPAGWSARPWRPCPGGARASWGC